MTTPRAKQIWTVGHSNHSPEAFLKLLSDAGIEQIADVQKPPLS